MYFPSMLVITFTGTLLTSITLIADSFEASNKVPSTKYPLYSAETFFPAPTFVPFPFDSIR